MKCWIGWVLSAVDELKYIWSIIWVHGYEYFTCQPLLILPKRSNWIMLTPVILSWSSSIEKLAKLTEINYFQDQWMCKKCTKFYTFFAMFLWKYWRREHWRKENNDLLTTCHIQVASLLVKREESEVHSAWANQGNSEKYNIKINGANCFWWLH